MSQLPREQLKVAAERAILVKVILPGVYFDEHDPFRELQALAETAGARVVGQLIQRRRKPRGRTYLGKGKVEELTQLAEMTEATLIIFDNDLSPAQIRELEEATSRKIIDRSELILDIFANRATTHMAKIQVEIAQLEYTYPRLRAMWDHLGQIVGGAPVGIGTRGPGEQQIEIDRRLVQRRLRLLKSELNDLQDRKFREVQQRNLDHYTVGLVGYTNAGKSTFFNQVTAGGAFSHDKLFATLSTRIERWELGGGNHVMLSDTVGFIHNLPHHLIASFRSTLEETVHAQLLIILIDAADPNAEMHLRTVVSTLDEIGAVDQPRIIALNKIDLLERNTDVMLWLNRHPESVPISAASGQGIEELSQRVFGHLLGGVREVVVSIPLTDGKTLDFLEKRTEVLDRQYPTGKAELRVRMGRRHVDLLLARGAQFTLDGMPPMDVITKLWPNPPSVETQRTPPHAEY